MSNDSLAPHPAYSQGPDFQPGPFEPEPFDPGYPVIPPRRRFQTKLWKHVLLFALTLITTTLVGALHYAGFRARFDPDAVRFDWWLLAGGLWYSAPALLFLGAHEMGHYVACRYYNVDASLPYFLPLLIPTLGFQTGTLGAVIRIREAFQTRTMLFDIGIAGPLSGFLVLIPMLFLGLSLSEVLPAPPQLDAVYLGEPLLFQWFTRLVLGTVQDGYSLNAHPLVFAAWLGMLATALNLLPFGQLDGGHISYALFGRASSYISIATVGTALVMTFVTISWLLLTLMMLVMLFVLGPGHPRVIHEYEPLGPGRRRLALVALVILVICFTPVPIRPME
ncbi:MAG: site-2 protease family protein [Acidobacteria bacterium]|nr:site-2 protease family protein [Acidobacteriota bacterium]